MPSHWLSSDCSALLVLLFSSLSAFLCELAIYVTSPLFVFCKSSTDFCFVVTTRLTQNILWIEQSILCWIQKLCLNTKLCLFSPLSLQESISFYIVYSLTTVFIMVVIVISNTLVLNLYTIITNTPFYSIRVFWTWLFTFITVVNFHITN